VVAVTATVLSTAVPIEPAGLHGGVGDPGGDPGVAHVDAGGGHTDRRSDDAAQTPPATSMPLWRSPGTSGSRTRPAVTAHTAMTTLTYRHHRQPRYPVSAPPSSKPETAPLPATAPYRPKALARERRSVKVVATNARALGARTAAKAPCRARPATSGANRGAAPANADATAKPASPYRNVRRRPKRSAARPPSSSSSPAYGSVYAVINHWRSLS
jgi:hypothetical protein